MMKKLSGEGIKYHLIDYILITILSKLQFKYNINNYLLQIKWQTVTM